MTDTEKQIMGNQVAIMSALFMMTEDDEVKKSLSLATEKTMEQLIAGILEETDEG